MKAPRITEAQLQTYGTQLLEADGWRALRTDPVSRREWGKGFGEKGMADMLYVRYLDDALVHIAANTDDPPSTNVMLSICRVMWIEWKRKGGKVAAHQTAWHELERKRGALTLIAGENFEATPESFYEWYKNSGLMRKDIR